MLPNNQRCASLCLIPPPVIACNNRHQVWVGSNLWILVFETEHYQQVIYVKTFTITEAFSQRTFIISMILISFYSERSSKIFVNSSTLFGSSHTLISVDTSFTCFLTSHQVSKYKAHKGQVTGITYIQKQIWTFSSKGDLSVWDEEKQQQSKVDRDDLGNIHCIIQDPLKPYEIWVADNQSIYILRRKVRFFAFFLPRALFFFSWR